MNSAAFWIGFSAVMVIVVGYILWSGGPMEMARKDRIRRRKQKKEHSGDEDE